MVYARSSPWMMKLLILLANVLKRADTTAPSPQFALRVLLSVTLYVVASLLPSICCSIRDRALTMEYSQLSLLMLTNGYALICWGLKDDAAVKHVMVILQFILMHILYAQSVYLHEKTHVLHFSNMYCYLNIAVAIFAVSMLSLRTPSMDLERHDAIVIMIAMFTGEILGSVAYAQYLLIRVISDIYESVAKSVSMF